MLKHVSCQDGAALLTNDAIRWLDIRALADFQHHHIPGATHLPKDALTPFIDSIEKSTPLVVYCYHGVSSVSVGNYLLAAGFLDVSTLDGGFSEWHLTITTATSSTNSL